MQDAPPVMCNDKEAVQHSKRQRRHGEEVHRGNGFPMIAEKCCPSFCRLGASRRSPHPAQHGSFRNFEAKHHQLAVDARNVPSWVLGNHAEDELAQVYADALPARSRSVSRKPCPIRFESGTVPANDCLRLDEDQRLLPSRPEPFKHHPEQHIENSKSRLWMSLLQDGKLLPESQIL